MKFEDLSPRAQAKAVRDYRAGWPITHNKERIEESEAWAILTNSEENYDEHGRYTDEEEEPVHNEKPIKLGMSFRVSF